MLLGLRSLWEILTPATGSLDFTVVEAVRDYPFAPTCGDLRAMVRKKNTPASKSKHAELISRWGRWLHRLVRSFGRILSHGSLSPPWRPPRGDIFA
jgi:hypothetical protein